MQGIPKQILAVPLVSLQYEQPDFLVHQDKGDHEDRVVMQGLHASRFASLCSTTGEEHVRALKESQAWIPERSADAIALEALARVSELGVACWGTCPAVPALQWDHPSPVGLHSLPGPGVVRLVTVGDHLPLPAEPCFDCKITTQ